MNPGQDASQTPATGEWGGVHPILPTRVAEGASPANDATGGAPGFQRRFVFGVALFLALTGGVKLAAVLQESRVLGAADPLLPWLTGRQMLFLAAGLELGVAAAVFRNRAARWAPWLILWLVSVFGTCRLGLWAMGFQGHCPCLGHLFARWPEFEAWAARLLLASLAVMGLGSAVCILAAWLGRSMGTMSQRTGRVAVTLPTIGSSLFLLTATLLANESVGGRKAFFVEGLLTGEHLQLSGWKPFQACHVRLEWDADQWLIRAACEANPAVGETQQQLFAFNREGDVYAYVEFLTEEGGVLEINGVQFRSAFAYSELNRTVNLKLRVPWLVYAPSNLLGRLSDRCEMQPWDIHSDVEKDPPSRSIRYHDLPPYTAKEIEFWSGSIAGEGVLLARIQAHAWRPLGGLSLPARGAYEKFQAKPFGVADAGEIVARQTWIATNMGLLDRLLIPDQIDGGVPVTVKDRRFSDRLKSQDFSYTAKTWLRRDDRIVLESLSRKQAEDRHFSRGASAGERGVPPSRIASITLCILIALPVLIKLATVFRSRNSL